MSAHDCRKFNGRKEEAAKREMFNQMLDKLEKSNVDDQKHIVEEMKHIVVEMGQKELKSILKVEFYNELEKIIKERKLIEEQVFQLIKKIGCCKVLNEWSDLSFEESLLDQRFKNMIAEEEKKEEKKDERLLTDISECYILLDETDFEIPKSLLSHCVRSLLKVALKKEEDEETQNEAEIALLTLSNIDNDLEIEQELHLSEIKEIIQYHQEHHNLTRLACQSAWDFFVGRLNNEEDLGDEIEKELHFVKEATRELGELTRCVDWKRNEEEQEKTKEVQIIRRWLDSVQAYIYFCYDLQKEESDCLTECVARLYRAVKNTNKRMCDKSIKMFGRMINSDESSSSVFGATKAAGCVLEEMQRTTLNHDIVVNCLEIFSSFSRRMQGEMEEEWEEEELKKMKRGIFEGLEEEGYEDTMTSYHETFSFFNTTYYAEFSENLNNFFVSV